MSYLPPPYGGSSDQPGQQPGWQGQQPGWQGQQPGSPGQGWQDQQPGSPGQGWPGQQPGWPGQQPGWPGQQPGWPAQQASWPGQPEPNNHLVWAILTTLLCCLPFGVASIVYSTKVSGLWMQGRYEEAQAAADNAKKWAIVSAIAFGVVIVIYVVVVILIAILGGDDISNTTPSTRIRHY